MADVVITGGGVIGCARALCLASLRLYPALVGSLLDETSIDVQYLETGLLVPAESEPAAAALRQVARHGGDDVVPLEWVEGETLRRLEPGLSPALPGAAYSPSQRHVNPGLLTQALARAAVARGATLRQGEGVSAFLRRGGRVTGVRTEGGDAISASHVVLAAGPWT